MISNSLVFILDLQKRFIKNALDPTKVDFLNSRKISTQKAKVCPIYDQQWGQFFLQLHFCDFTKYHIFIFFSNFQVREKILLKLVKKLYGVFRNILAQMCPRSTDLFLAVASGSSLHRNKSD